MTPRSRWLDWTPDEQSDEPFVGFVGGLTKGERPHEERKKEENLQNQQNKGTPLLSKAHAPDERADKTHKTPSGEESGDRQNRQNAAARSMDRIAELVVRHHLGQYAGTSVGRRLDALFSIRTDDLAAIEAALLRACDYLRIDGSQLDAMNEQADRLAATAELEAAP